MVNSMNSRMERYKSEETTENYSENKKQLSRVSRNNDLYQDIKTNELSRVRHNDNIRVIENNGKTIDLEKIRRYVTEINEQPRAVRRSMITSVDEKVHEEDVSDTVPKDYDINSVLEKAKKTREIDYDRERYKKLRDTQYDILSKIDMYDEVKDEEEVPGMKDLQDEFNTDERTLIDLINTVTIHKGELNLLDELMGGEDEETTDPIEQEVQKGDMKKDIRETIEKEEKMPIEVDKTRELSSLKKKKSEIDNSFYTNSMSFSKDDFEGFDELEKSVKKNGILSTIMIIVLVVFILATLVIMANYVFDLGLF